MKPIKEYISKNYEMPEQFNELNKWQTFEEFLDLNNIEEETFTQDDINVYFSKNFSQYNERFYDSQISWIRHITENLNSHDSEKLADKLKEKFSKWIKNIENESNKNTFTNTIKVFINDVNPIINIPSIDSCELNKTKEGDEFQHIIDLYGYYLTYVEYDVDGFKIYLEPLFTEDVSNKILLNGGKIYHVCSKEAAEKINKLKMFRAKVGKTRSQDTRTGYRYFPRRLFFIMNGKTKEDTIKEIENALIEKNFIDKEYVIFEVLVKYYINQNQMSFYVDNAMKNSNLSIYTYHSIPFAWSRHMRQWTSIDKFKEEL